MRSGVGYYRSHYLVSLRPDYNPYTQLIDPAYLGSEEYAKGWRELWSPSSSSSSSSTETCGGYWPRGPDFDPIPKEWRRAARPSPSGTRYFGIYIGRPMDDPTEFPVLDPTVTDEAFYVRWRCVKRGPPSASGGKAREFAVPGAVYAGDFTDAYHAALFAHFGIILDQTYFNRVSLRGAQRQVMDRRKVRHTLAGAGSALRMVWYLSRAQPFHGCCSRGRRYFELLCFPHVYAGARQYRDGLHYAGGG
jgi:hypothetical protein